MFKKVSMLFVFALFLVISLGVSKSYAVTASVLKSDTTVAFFHHKKFSTARCAKIRMHARKRFLRMRRMFIKRCANATGVKAKMCAKARKRLHHRRMIAIRRINRICRKVNN
jgi:hypothetical protein